MDHRFVAAQIYPVDEFRKERPGLWDVFRDCVDGRVHRDFANLFWVVDRIAQHFRTAIRHRVAGVGQRLRQRSGVAVGHDRAGYLTKNPVFKFAGLQEREASVFGAGCALVDEVVGISGCAELQGVSAVAAMEETFQHACSLAFSSGHVVALLMAISGMGVSFTRDDNVMATLAVVQVVFPRTGRKGRDITRCRPTVGLLGGSSSCRMIEVTWSPIGTSNARGPPAFLVSCGSKIQPRKGGCGWQLITNSRTKTLKRRS